MIIHNPILTGSFTVNGTDVASITSSAASITALNSYTASQNILNGTYTLTSSFAAQTASFTAFTSSVNSFTASQLVLNGTYATTGSNTFAGIQTVNSNLVVTGSITAQTLVVQTVTSSVVYSSGSNVFGNSAANTQVFTGSVSMNPNGLFVSSSGNVGIGTITPLSLLDVYASGGGTVRLSGASASSGSNYGTLIFSSNNATYKDSSAAIASDGESVGLNSGNLKFYTGGRALAMTIGSSGNVGIGTSSPSAISTFTTLEIRGATGGGIKIGKTATAQFNIQQDGTDAYLNNTANGTLYIYTNDTPKMAITSAGKVGIGNSLGYNALDVKGTGTSTTVLEGIAGFYKATAKGGALVIQAHDTVADIAATWYSAATDMNLTFTTVPSNGTYYERMRITSAGNILIGTTTDYTSKLVIIPATNSTTSTGANNQISLGEVSNNTGYCLKLGYISIGGGYQGSIQSISGGVGSALLLNNSGGSVLIGTTSNAAGGVLAVTANGVVVYDGSNYRQMYQSGNYMYWYNGANQAYLTNTGVWTNASDISIKKDIKDIEYGLNEVLRLKPRWYKMKEDDTEQIGFISQEVEEVIKEVVSTDNKGMKGLSYGNLTAVLTKAIQELKAEIDELKNK